jgi:uncharacterized RDD family membrane protein YckC
LHLDFKETYTTPTSESRRPDSAGDETINLPLIFAGFFIEERCIFLLEPCPFIAMVIQTERKLLKRSVAMMIDYAILMAFIIWFMATYGVPTEDGYTVSGIKGIVIPIVWVAYFPITEWMDGKTLGKLILGLTVVTEHGGRISFTQALKRHILDMIDIIAIANTPRHQRLGDLWAKTLVIGGDSFRCRSCYQEATLSNEEILKGEFECPICYAANKNADTINI